MSKRKGTDTVGVCGCHFGRFRMLVAEFVGTQDNLPDDWIGARYIAMAIIPDGVRTAEQQLVEDGSDFIGVGETIGTAIDNCLIEWDKNEDRPTRN